MAPQSSFTPLGHQRKFYGKKRQAEKNSTKKRQATLFVVFISFIFLFTHLFLLDHFVFKSFAGRLFFVPGEERGSKDWGFKKKIQAWPEKVLIKFNDSTFACEKRFDNFRYFFVKLFSNLLVILLF